MPPTKSESDNKWIMYVRECDKLAEMRAPISTCTELEIQLQLQLTERLLQEWINSVECFRATLN